LPSVSVLGVDEAIGEKRGDHFRLAVFLRRSPLVFQV